jgi:hypothetical protein
MLSHLLLLSLSLLTATSFALEEPQDGVIVGHLFPECNGMGRKKPIHVPVDRCVTTPKLGLQIKTPAVCANGTRAQWARFTNKTCGNGTLDEYWGLVPLVERDIGACLDIMKVGSMAFWCDGVKPKSPDNEDTGDDDKEKDHAKKGSSSESACMVGKAPFWNHPAADTCVTLKTDKVQLTAAAVCRNGTQSTAAFYKGAGCHGIPQFRTVEGQKGRDCENVEDFGSFAYYCTGEGIEEHDRGRPGVGNGERKGGIMHFMLVLSLIIMCAVLILILTVITWINKYGGSLGQIIQSVRVSHPSLVLRIVVRDD